MVRESGAEAETVDVIKECGAVYSRKRVEQKNVNWDVM